MTPWKYLHPVEGQPGFFILDHKLTPEVSAMFAAMASRVPAGGIHARYSQIVEAVARALWVASLPPAPDYNPDRSDLPTWENLAAEAEPK